MAIHLVRLVCVCGTIGGVSFGVRTFRDFQAKKSISAKEYVTIALATTAATAISAIVPPVGIVYLAVLVLEENERYRKN